MEFVFTFLEGIASFISPCILPLIPIYISYFTGKDPEKNKALSNSIAFVLGFSFIFILLAILTNRIGLFVTEYLKYFKIAFGIIIIFLGLNYMEVFKLKIFERFKFYKIIYLWNPFFRKCYTMYWNIFIFGIIINCK